MDEFVWNVACRMALHPDVRARVAVHVLVNDSWYKKPTMGRLIFYWDAPWQK